MIYTLDVCLICLQKKKTGKKNCQKKGTFKVETKKSGYSATGTPECVEYMYGGCKGNVNKFPNKLACIGHEVREPPEPPAGKVPN